jgi:predicted RNA-binding protein with PUA-like domain
MAAYWILKTEPSAYSYERLERERTAVWDGVTNPLALKHIRSMTKGDRVMIYHTGDVKAVVGLAEVVSDPYPDPKDRGGTLWVVDIKANRRLPRPVGLTEIKHDAAFKDMALVRMGRLSVAPVTAAQWQRLLAMGGQA